MRSRNDASERVRSVEQPSVNNTKELHKKMGAALLAIGLGTAVLIVKTLNNDNDQDKRSETIASVSPPTASPKSELSSVYSISLPKFPSATLPTVRLGHVSDFELPEGWPLSRDFLQSSKKVGDFFKKNIEGLPKELEESPNNRHKILNAFIGRMNTVISSLSPEMNTQIDNLYATWGGAVSELMELYNPFLISQGLYIDISVMDDGLTFAIFEITRKEALDIGKDSFKKSVPIYHLRMIHSFPKSKRLDQYFAIAPSPFNRIVVFGGHEARIDRNISKTKEMMPDFPPIKDQVLSDYIKHEGVHVILGEEFPVLGPETKPIKFRVDDLMIRVGGKTVLLNGNYTPLQFQELAAVGAQIALSGDNAHLHFSTFFFAKTEQYHLVHQLLPLAAVAYAPYGPEKIAAIDSVLKTGGIKPKAIARVASKISTEEMHKLGMQLYEIGYHYLKQAENGKLPKVGLRK